MNGYLIVVPARSGSKGIKNKNIVDLCGKPLINYTLEPLRNLRDKGEIDEYIVSTDSPIIAAKSELVGAKIPYLRPAELAEDTTKTVDVILDIISFLEQSNVVYKGVVLLQPTSPLRKEVDIIEAIRLFDSSQSESLISVYLEEHLNEMMIYKRNGNVAIPFNANHNKGMRRQDIDRFYIRNGAIYITSIKYLKENRSLISDNPLLFEMPKERSVNIDSADDLRQAEEMLSCK